MSIDFNEFLTGDGQANPEHRQALESSYHEAARVMSPRGLQNYVEGIRAMRNMGRGEDLVLTYIQEMPGVAREVGEDIVPDIVTSLMKLASHTSGTVITLMMSNMPLAARRLGDVEVMRAYLKLLHQLAGRAPRGLRPMMENLDELLSKLTLGGLRRWVQWGMQAHQRDLEGQMAYFGLKTESARAVLQKERRGTLFIDNQRKLNFYLRALWGRAFFMRPTSGDYESRQGLRPFIEDFQLHLPDAFDSFHGIPGLDIYRAAAAHGAAHMVYTNEPLSAEQLSPIQMKFIELFEDARIEQLAIRDFPGLSKLWLRFFEALETSGDSLPEMHPTMGLMTRMARALLDEQYRDELDYINVVAEDFRNDFAVRPASNEISWKAGIAFYNRVADQATIPGLRQVENMPVPYRDDNRYVWSFADNPFVSQGVDYLP